jgi:hypothetical protein
MPRCYLKSLVRKILGEDRYARLVPVLKELLALLKRKDLPSLARIFGSDKWGHHRYANHYQRFLQQLRKTKVVLLEITIGGYADPLIGMIVDGGSHINTHVWTTFETLLALLADDGTYVVEDTQTSYSPGVGGKVSPRQDQTTLMGYFKHLADGINHMEWIRPGYQPTNFDRHVVAIHFLHNMIFVFKGRNGKTSNAAEVHTTDFDYVLKPSA